MDALKYITPKIFLPPEGIIQDSSVKDTIAGCVALPLSIALAIASGVNPSTRW